MTSMASIREPWPDTCTATGGFMEVAACGGVDPAVFYPELGVSSAGAKAICHSCSAMDECLEYALEQNERYGVWGGKSENERRKLKRRRGLSPDVAVKESPVEVRLARKAGPTCKHGHDHTNHWHVDQRGRGYCKECHRLRVQKWREQFTSREPACI